MFDLAENSLRSIQGHYFNYLGITSVPTGEDLYRFYHIWARRPYWSCDLDRLNNFLFSKPPGSTYEILTDDDGRRRQSVPILKVPPSWN